MRIIIISLIIVLSLIVLVSCDKKVEKSAIFTGRVTASDTSTYLADVHVFEQSHKNLKTTTDSLGFFRLDGVSFEEHNIYFEKEGFEPYTLLFEYNGGLTNPIITELIVLYQPGEEKIEIEEDEGDSLDVSPQDTASH